MKNKFVYLAIVVSAAFSAFAASEGSTCVTQDDPPGLPCQCFDVPNCDLEQSGNCHFLGGAGVDVTCICNGSQEVHDVAQCVN